MLKKMRENQSWPPAGPERKESEYMKRIGPSASVPDQVRQDAFALVGKTVFPEKVVVADNAFYVYQIVDARQGGEVVDKDKRHSLEQQLLAVQNNKLMADWLGQLRKEAKIWTNAQMLQ
jgi:peptidyl-prolyl cis-trans isomerase D